MVRLTTPRVAIAGLSGDGGKTLVSLGLARAFAARGTRVRTAKKGPDYIDAAWLGAASGAECTNLDTFLMDDAALGRSLGRVADAGLLVIEGNRGLFDGGDAVGSDSTAALARRLAAPVLLVVDCTKRTRTVAALVLGCRDLEPDLRLAGVILNKIGTARQEAVIREAVEQSTGVPVVGAIPRIKGDDPLPGRHLGLVTVEDHPEAEQALETAARVVGQSVDLDQVAALARSAPAVTFPAVIAPGAGAPCRIGVFRGPAFSFYYPENLSGLEDAGATLVPVSPWHDEELPEIDGLYIGGGFPEVHADRLAGNRALAADLRRRVDAGLPVYAECGGLMYLARELVVGEARHAMAGVLDLVVEQTSRPRGHGYEVGRTDRDTGFFPTGTELRGHEFHYSRIVGGADVAATSLALSRGTGIQDRRDGVVRGRVWASYLHLHAAATPDWATGFLSLARTHRAERGERAGAWG
jgi:cobyrinic acid a,c-diamide synthase